jgi:ABC-2 type transport system ATP-binding protein
MAILEVESVTKQYDKLVAVDNVNFSVDQGQVYGMLGPNGAGKTTAIRMIMNIIMPDSGTIRLFGRSLTDELKSRIGYLPEERGLYPKMKVDRLLAFLGELNGLPASETKSRVDEWLERFDLDSSRDKKVQELSKGMQQKLQFISTILHDPDLIILDEPFSGLDPVNVNLIKNIMLDLKEQGKAIMLSTHMMETAEKLCDHVLMINKGKKVLDGPLGEIQKKYGKNAVHLQYDGNGGFIKDLPFVKKVDDYGKYIEVELNDGSRPNDLLKEIIPNVSVLSMQSQKSSLNEIFISLAREV